MNLITSLNSYLSPGTEFYMFMTDSSIIPRPEVSIKTGYLPFVPPFFTVTASWASLEPPEDQLGLFRDILLKRELIQQFIPSAIVTEWEVSTQPTFVYSRPHWSTPIFGGEVPDTDPGPGPDALWGMRWYLVYATSSDAEPVQFLDQAVAADTQRQLANNPVELYSQDSQSSPSDGDINSAPNFTGWTLLLLHKYFSLAAPPNPPTVRFAWYGAWSLELPPDSSDEPVTFRNGSVASTIPIFDPFHESKWQIFHNPLNFPSHTLTLKSFQP